MVSIIQVIISFFLVTLCSGQRGPCESDEWAYLNGHCYWSSINQNSVSYQKQNWFAAERECRRLKSDLASIHNEGENYFVHKLTRCANTWNGLVRVSRPGVSDHTYQAYGWIDVTDRNFNKFYPGYPNVRTHYPCTRMHQSTNEHSGKWVTDHNCGDSKFYYVCKKQAIGNFNASADVYTHKVRGSCRPGWYQLRNKCYHINTTRVDFFEALMQCEHIKGRLVTLHSSGEDADLTRMFDACDTPWIGLENTDPNKVNSNAGWRWADYSVLTYTNWNGDKPHNDRARQCGRLDHGAVWTNVNCWELHPFVCEYKLPNYI